jgi:hypothetical protein
VNLLSSTPSPSSIILMHVGTFIHIKYNHQRVLSDTFCS